MPLNDLFTEDQVENLPYVISSVQSSSDRINLINAKHVTRHERVLSCYECDIKIINVDITEKLKIICCSAKEKISEAHSAINKHFVTLEMEDRFSSAEQFKTIWSLIQNKVNEILGLITGMDHDMNKSCEHARIDRIRQVMAHYYDKIICAGLWDSQKLMSFLNKDIVSLNKDLLNNYRQYATVISNMKAATLLRLIDYRREWEKHLLGWRDFLVKKNISIVQEMFLSKEFEKPKEIGILRSEVLNQLNKNDDLIINLYKEILISLPYIGKRISPLSRKIREIMEDKQRIATKYLNKSASLHETLIQKVEKKLHEIKEYLFKEASCNEEQFQKSFSMFIKHGEMSYEKIAQEVLRMDERNVTNNLAIMTEVHSFMMQFLYKIDQEWRENADKIKSQRKDLLDDIKKCRDRHNSSSRIIEKDIAKCMGKISQISSSVKLDKLHEKVSCNLNMLKQKMEDLFSQMEALIVAYPKRCLNQSSFYESSMLASIGLKRVTQDATRAILKSTQANDANEIDNNCFVLISGDIYEKLHQDDCITEEKSLQSVVTQLSPNSQEIIKELMKLVNQKIVDHILSNKKNYKETYELLILKLQNEINEESKVRADVHYPREQLIFKEFKLRKVELDKYSNSFKELKLCFEEFEAKLTDVEKKFSDDANAILTSIEEAIQNAYKIQLNLMKSKDLICHNSEFEGVLWDLEHKISDKAKGVFTSIETDTKVMRETEDRFMEYAIAGNFEWGEKSKNYSEFCERRDQVRDMILHSKRNIKQLETLKNKKISVAIQNYKSHYKHCLLDLYFLEMKSMHLAKVKMQIKCACSHGDLVFPKIKKLLKDVNKSITEFDGDQPERFCRNIQSITSYFAEGFMVIKSLINFYNFRCSPISVPAEISLDQLNQKYRSFSAPDSSIDNTIEFTRNILKMTSTSCKLGTFPSSTDGLLEESDDNWLTDSNTIEKKYLTGKITCVYGVGANILDTANQHWSNTSSAQVSVNSFWLSRNPEGLQALKGLRTEKNVKERLGGLTPTSESIQEDNSSKLKELSAMIRNLVAPSIIDKISYPETKNSKVSPQQLRNQFNCADGETSQSKLNGLSNEFCNTEDGTPSKVNTMSKDNSTITLPAISKTKIEDNEARKCSLNQMNMAKVLNLNKTVDLLKRTSNTRRKRTTHVNRNQNIPIYDFLVMTDDELRTFVFDPLSFFNLQRRNYNVEHLCENIVSVTEKVKFYLLHLQEDFIISCLIFYRQKHLSIKHRQRMKPNHESTIIDFTEQLKKYFENVQKTCDNQIQKIKDILFSMYKAFLGAPQIVFGKILSKFKDDFSALCSTRSDAYQYILQKTKFAQKELSSALHPHLTHPENRAVLDRICFNEKALSKSVELEAHNDKTITLLSACLKEYESIIELGCDKLIKVAESAIQVEDIRKMTKRDGNAFEVQKRLRKNLTLSTSLPTPIGSRTSNSGLVTLVNQQKLCSTISRLVISVQKEKEKTLSHFRSLHSMKIEHLKNVHLKTLKETQGWHLMFAKSIDEIKTFENTCC